MAAAMTFPSLLEAALRMLLAIVPAAAIGLERELSGQPAGIRTHVLLALGASLFTLAGLTLGGPDAARIAAQVVTGVGFIGAGAILRDSHRVKGLTTAASLWVTAAIGVAAGLGAYAALAAAVVAALLVLLVVPTLQRRMLPYRRQQRIEVSLEPSADADTVAARIGTVLPGFSVTRVRRVRDGGRILTGEARLKRGSDPVDVIEEIAELPGVRDADLAV
jgi:putative Mg2+ transporter-C (MgtC) family protein